EISVATDFILPAGNWSIVVGSNQAGATASAVAPDNNVNIGTPGYFFFNGSGWANGGITAVRLFAQITPCGDGNPDTGEACDDGNQSNTDACLTSCAAASCGDGFLRTGVEECDDGDDNSDSEPDACRMSCAVASCGDDVVDS